LDWFGRARKGPDQILQEKTEETEGKATGIFLPPPGGFGGVTSVYKRDKGLFARGFCILKCVHRCVRKCAHVYKV
jgi:hypothetical protein